MKIEEKKWCVYIHRNKINNKAYIGITSDNPKSRWKYGFGYKYNKYFYSAILKYKWHNFEHIIWAEGLSEDDAKAWEIRLIALFKTNCIKYNNPNFGYNMTDGGDGANGAVRSEETKGKIRKNAKERLSNPENNPMFGKHHSEESKRKMSEIRQGMNNGDKNPMYGRPWWDKNTPQEKIDMWLNNKSLAASGEKNPNYGIACTEEKRNKLIKGNPHRKSIIHLEIDGITIIEEYDSIRDANRKTSIDRRILQKYCNGSKKTLDDTIWKFNNEGEDI